MLYWSFRAAWTTPGATVPAATAPATAPATPRRNDRRRTRPDSPTTPRRQFSGIRDCSLILASPYLERLSEVGGGPLVAALAGEGDDLHLVRDPFAGEAVEEF